MKKKYKVDFTTLILEAASKLCNATASKLKEHVEKNKEDAGLCAPLLTEAERNDYLAEESKNNYSCEEIKRNLDLN